MYKIKKGYGCGIKATLLTPAGGVCNLRKARYIAANLVLPSGSTMQCEDFAYNEVTNTMYVKLLPTRDLTTIGEYGIFFNVQLEDKTMYSTAVVVFAAVSEDAAVGYHELTLSFSLTVVNFPSNVSFTGASPKIGDKNTWLVYNDELNAYVDTGIDVGFVRLLARYDEKFNEFVTPCVEATNAAKESATQANTAALGANDATTKADAAANDAEGAGIRAATAADAADAATSGALSAASAATEATRLVAEVIRSAKDLEDRIESSETGRLEAELKRVAAETTRATAETSREAAETKRQADTTATIERTNQATGAATVAATLANQKAQQASVTIVRLEDLEESLVGEYKVIPKAINLKYPDRVTFGNTTPLRINYELLPVNTGRNVLFLGDNNAVSVMPNGEFVPKRPGVSTIHVIPTENTGLCKTIQITVAEPDLRKVGSSLRLMGNGNLRLT